MSAANCLNLVLDVLRDCRGVIDTRLLTDEEKKKILIVEEKAEEKIAYGMCKTVNKGVREALSMQHTAGLVIDSQVFEYPHHPGMRMICGDTIVGEQVKDKARVEELKKNRSNFFLWDEFVLYMPKLPRGAEERKKLRMIYTERPAAQIDGHPCVLRSVLGTPSMEGDLVVKELLSARGDKPTVGTCLVGFELNKDSSR